MAYSNKQEIWRIRFVKKKGWCQTTEKYEILPKNIYLGITFYHNSNIDKERILKNKLIKTCCYEWFNMAITM